MEPWMVKRRATIEDLLNVPEGQNGELIDGEIFVSPRPSSPHALASSRLLSELIPPFDRGKGGPGGWWILHEPELLLGDDVLVPDLAGWRKERMPEMQTLARFELVPDWICEVASPSTERLDRIKKMPVYAECGVRHLWLVRPDAKLVEAYSLDGTSWRFLGAFDDEKAPIPPFEAVAIEISSLWISP